MPQFAVALRKHETFGYLFSAYRTEQKNEKNFKILQRISPEDVVGNPDLFTDEQKEIVRIIDSYSDQSLIKIFSKKKVSQLDFLRNAKKETIENRIRPFIEQRLFRVYKLVRDNNISVFALSKGSSGAFFEDDFYQLNPTPAKTIFSIKRSPEGVLYSLVLSHSGKEISLTDKGGFILSNASCLLVLGKDIFHFKDTDGKKLLPFFDKKYIQVPKSVEKKWFKTFAAKAVKKYTVKPEGFDIKRIKADLRPVLTLENDWKGEFSFSLHFDYGGTPFNFSDNKENTVSFDSETIQFTTLERDTEKENNIAEGLFDKGLENYDGSLFRVDVDSENQNHKKQKTLEWYAENKVLLEEEGFRLEQDFDGKKYNTQGVRLNFSVHAKKDWFDIRALVIFGKYKIPFMKLRHHILNEEQEYKLPNGEIALIPELWFSKYRDILQVAKSQKDGMRLDKHHFTEIEELDVDLDKGGGYLSVLQQLMNEPQEDTPVPDDIRAELRPYQRAGYSRLYKMQNHRLGLCLADDMGLGKTLQTITLLQKLKDELKFAKSIPKQPTGTGDVQLSLFGSPVSKADTEETAYAPSLIVMPVSLIHNWKNEIMKFSPFLKVLIYHGSKRFKRLKKIQNYDVILTGYGIVRNDIEELSTIRFLNVILDESQFIKNPDSQIHKAVMQLNSDNRLILTGTPVENSLSDLWSQMNFINPGLLGNRKWFEEVFQYPVEKLQSEEHILKLKQKISPFILRRTKHQVAKDLPPISEQVIYCKMSDEQAKIYETENSKVRNELLESMNDPKLRRKNAIRIIQALTKLRQIANHPVLTDKTYEDLSGKFSEILRATESISSEGHKIIIFSSFVKHLNLFAEAFDNMKLKYSLLTGKTTNREKVITDFQNKEEIKVFLISLKAGGTGLNLTAADYVFISDPWWNPATEKQAVNRAHRIGQDKKVFVYKYISKKTVEEKILDLQKHKQQLADETITGDNLLKGLDEEKIIELFA
ncbi:MAG: DEAD/DEAH box helicase [Bacteroidota bacterium]|nr:DEAD/DEAH box helicase [Bacteroidota bacterium]